MHLTLYRNIKLILTEMCGYNIIGVYDLWFYLLYTAIPYIFIGVFEKEFNRQNIVTCNVH